MNIHRVQTGSTANATAGQTRTTTTSSTGSNQASDSATKPAPVAAFGVKGEGVNPRLAAYKDKISARIENALKAENLSDRQRYALETAKTKFEGLVQRLDEAYSTESSNAGKKPIKAGLDQVMQMLRSNFNHVTSGGNIDVKA